MALDDYIEDCRQDVLKARSKADGFLAIAATFERRWRDAETDYKTAHAVYGKALEECAAKRQR